MALLHLPKISTVDDSLIRPSKDDVRAHTLESNINAKPIWPVSENAIRHYLVAILDSMWRLSFVPSKCRYRSKIADWIYFPILAKIWMLDRAWVSQYRNLISSKAGCAATAVSLAIYQQMQQARKCNLANLSKDQLECEGSVDDEWFRVLTGWLLFLILYCGWVRTCRVKCCRWWQ